MRDTAQERVMNALGNSLFHDVVNQTYKYNINQYYADKPFGGHSQKTVFQMRNKEQYAHTLSRGLLVIVHYTVQIHPC